MPYPAAPWTLYGEAFSTLHLIDVDNARAFVPAHLDIVSVLPGKTLGGIYLAKYGTGSVLQYHEMIAIAAWVSHKGKMGGWVSHIYVDNADSLAGGRHIWGLPKQLAEFTWQTGESHKVSVWQQDRLLCNFSCGQPFSLWQQDYTGAGFSIRGTDLLYFNANLRGRPGLVSAQLEVPGNGFLSALNLGHPWLTIAVQEMRLIVDEPAVVDRQAPAYSYR